MDEPQGLHAIITGTVQGVFFRANTHEKAMELKLTGWVRNLSNGSVEVHAFGAKSQLNNLNDWLQHGPHGANVKQCTLNSIPFEAHVEFIIAPSHDVTSSS
jgi:acylphosphatase